MQSRRTNSRYIQARKSSVSVNHDAGDDLRRVDLESMRKDPTTREMKSPFSTEDSCNQMRAIPTEEIVQVSQVRTVARSSVISTLEQMPRLQLCELLLLRQLLTRSCDRTFGACSHPRRPETSDATSPTFRFRPGERWRLVPARCHERGITS